MASPVRPDCHISPVQILVIALLMLCFSQSLALADQQRDQRGRFNIRAATSPIKAARDRIHPISKSHFDQFNTISSLAIPANTNASSVSFFGIDLSSSVTAAADTDGDRAPDSFANFIASDDPDNEITSALAVSKKSGKYYLGVIAVAGPNQQQAQLIVADNPMNSYQGVKLSQFSLGRGTPLAMVVLDSPKGDILVVATLFFEKGLLDLGSNDSYTITAYLPGANGIPDGKQTVPIVAAGAMLNNSPINLGFGGLTLDSSGTLYANLATKMVSADGSPIIVGAIVAFRDSDGDGIPDKPSTFVAGSESDPAPTTASSIIVEANPGGGSRLIAYGVNDIFRQPTKIVIYTDQNSDLQADGAPALLYQSTPQYQGNISSFGDGSSAVEVSHLDFAEGEALFSFTTFDSSGNLAIDAGVALVKESSNGSASTATTIFSAPKDSAGQAGITFVVGVPRTPDNIPPTVSITAPTAGQQFVGGMLATVSFRSSDNVGVVSHKLSFAADGVNFNFSLATGIAGSAQSAQFIVPNISSSNGAIKVEAFDQSGNVGSAIVAMLMISSDGIKPQVMVTAPQSKQKLIGNSAFTLRFSASDNVGVVSQEIQFSQDGGQTFTSVVMNLPGNATSFDVTVPNIKVKQGVIKVIARDGAGNTGEGLSGLFKIKPVK